MQHVAGSIGDRSGSFVLQTAGTFDGAKAAGEWTVVANAADRDAYVAGQTSGVAIDPATLSYKSGDGFLAAARGRRAA